MSAHERAERTRGCWISLAGRLRVPDPETGELRGNRNLKRLNRISQRKQDEEIKRTLELGLEAAESINDRSISLFARGHQPAFAGINTFLKMPYCEDVKRVGEYEAAFVGVPFDTGTTYRPGTRFGPQAVRRISAVYRRRRGRPVRGTGHLRCR